MSSSRRRTAFTLVEMLMVAVILAILAVVVIPQFSDASEDVKVSAVRATLQTVRSQLELYKAQHDGKYPDADSLKWEAQMTGKTDIAGTASASGKFGPYLQQIPVNPMDDKKDLAGSQDGTGGWAYDADTGSFKANDSSVNSADSKTKDL